MQKMLDQVRKAEKEAEAGIHKANKTAAARTEKELSEQAVSRERARLQREAGERRPEALRQIFLHLFGRDFENI